VADAVISKADRVITVIADMQGQSVSFCVQKPEACPTRMWAVLDRDITDAATSPLDLSSVLQSTRGNPSQADAIRVMADRVIAVSEPPAPCESIPDNSLWALLYLCRRASGEASRNGDRGLRSPSPGLNNLQPLRVDQEPGTALSHSLSPAHPWCRCYLFTTHIVGVRRCESRGGAESDLSVAVPGSRTRTRRHPT
jgi:hypothetical protein